MVISVLSVAADWVLVHAENLLVDDGKCVSDHEILGWNARKGAFG